jgi:hypothetical protein
LPPQALAYFDSENYTLDDFPLMELILRRHYSNSIACQNQDPQVQSLLQDVQPAATQVLFSEWAEGAMDLAFESHGDLGLQDNSLISKGSVEEKTGGEDNESADARGYSLKVYAQV